MNYLALFNALKEKCGVSGPVLTSVTGQTGETARLLNYINDAWVDIQERHENWKFLESTFSFSTTASQQQYTPAQAGVTNLATWKKNSFRIYVTSIGFNSEIYFPELDYDEFRNLYQFGAMRSNYAKPVLYAVDPEKNLLLGPGPNATGYTVLGRYFSTPVELSAATDTPAIPSRFHRIIVYRAMEFYGSYESAPEVLSRGSSEYKAMLANLELDQLPAFEWGGPLA